MAFILIGGNATFGVDGHLILVENVWMKQTYNTVRNLVTCNYLVDFYFSGWPHPPIINAHQQNMIHSTVPCMLKNHVPRCADPTPTLRGHVT